MSARLLRAACGVSNGACGLCCRTLPLSSELLEYADEALALYGTWRGGWLAARRVCRCGPWHAGGFDPVP